LLNSINYSLHTQLHSLVHIEWTLPRRCSLVFLRSDDIIDLKDHLHDLGGELELMPLGGGGLEDTLSVHIFGALVVGVNSDEGVGLFDLFFTHLGDVLDGAETGVLGEGQGDLLKSVGESADSVLLNTLDLVSLSTDGNGASKLGGAATTNDETVSNHVTDNTDGVVEATSSFVTDGLGTTTDEDSDSL